MTGINLRAIEEYPKLERECHRDKIKIKIQLKKMMDLNNAYKEKLKELKAVHIGRLCYLKNLKKERDEALKFLKKHPEAKKRLKRTSTK